MLVDLLEYLITPCSWQARSVGFLTSSLQVQARYRRCRRAWQPHLDRTRSVILDAAQSCAQRRKVVILGAGLLHDIPLRELSALFREVVLVDLVFPWSSRLTAARFRNVRCLATDITGTIDALAEAARDPALPLPHSAPTLFQNDPDLDLTVSVNLLSQLPFIPKRYLQRKSFRPARSEASLQTWSRHLQDAHLAYLQSLPGHITLITDIAGTRHTRDGAIVERWDNLHGLELPTPSATWEWPLAPAPESDPEFDHVVKVAAFSEWKSTRCERLICRAAPVERPRTILCEMGRRPLAFAVRRLEFGVRSLKFSPAQWPRDSHPPSEATAPAAG